MATKVIYLRGYGYMEVPAELTGQELSKYAKERAGVSMAAPEAEAPKEEKKPEPSTMQQAAGFVAGLPAGLASGLVGSTLEGIGGLTGIRPVEEAGASFNEWVQEKLKQAVGEEAAASGASQVGQTIGGIASFFTPGVAAKVLGGAGKLVKAAPYLTAAMSGVQGAGEQVERMREQEAQGEFIDPAMRQLYALGAGAGTAALEAVPFGEALGRFAPMRRILGAIPSSVEAEAFGRAADTTLGKRLLEAGITGVGEAATESAQQVLQNVIEKQYNEQQAALEGIGEAALFGGVAGSALQGGAQLFRDTYIRRKNAQRNLEAQRSLVTEALPELAPGEESTVQVRGEDISLIEGERQKREKRAATEAILAPQRPLAITAGDTEAWRQIEKLRQDQQISNEQSQELFKQLEAQRQKELADAEAEARSQEEAQFRQEQIGSLPEFPGLLPDPAVKPIEEWSPLQRNVLNKYVQDMTPEQAKIFDDMTPEETRSFVEKSRAKAISQQQALEEASLKNMYAQESFDNFIRQRLSAKIKVDENFGIASDLARSEFKKPLGKLKDSEIIALGDLIDVRRSEIESQNQELAKKAQERTQANVEAAAVGLPEFGDPVYKLQNRVAYTRFGTQYKNLSDINKGRVDSLIESGQGKTVTPEEIAEEEDFKTRETLYNRDDYRSVKKELNATVRDESGLIPVSPDTIYAATKTAAEDPTSTIKPTRATSKEMFKHMIERGDVVEIEGKQYLNEGAPGPRFELPISSNPNIEQQQRAFNLKETERVIAPEIRDALKRRNLSDLFTIGLSEKIENTPNLGQYFNRVIRLSVAPDGKVRSVKEMIGSMDHEIVHGMREAGLISDPEWALLTTKFNADTLNDEQREKYTQLYRSQGMNDQKIKEALDEEAVAMKAKELNDIDPKRLDPSSLSLINKVRYFMDFGRNTAALGYKSAEDVLAAIKSGDIGKRGFTSEFELVDGKVKRVGMKEVSPRVGGQQDVEVETKVYGEEEEAADEKYQKALSGLASKFDRKTPIKNAQQYLIQDLDIAPEDVDGIIKRMMSSGDIVRVGKSRYVSDKARKSVETGATTPAAVGPTPQAPAKPVEKAAAPGKAELAPSQSQAVKNDPLASPQGSGAVTPFFVKKQPKGIIDKIKDTFKDNLSRQKMVDRYDPVRLMAIEAYSKTGDKRFLSAAEGSYHSLLFMDKAQDMALTGLETGGFKLEGSIILADDNPEIAPLKIFQRLKEKDKLDAFFNFAYAKRYKDLKDAGKDPGGTISEQDVNREYDRWVNDKDIDTEIKNFKQYNDNLVDILRKSGFISVGEAKAWKSSFYIPFYRIPTIKTQDGMVDTGEVDAPKMNSQVTNLSNPKGLTGRDLSVNDAIENIVANTYYMVGTAAKNFSARKVARDGVLTGYMKPIDKPGDAAQGANVITIRENGVKKHYEVRDESLYNAVAESGFPVQDVLKGMALATEALRRGTTLSPTFIIRNTIRDTLQAWTLGRFGNNLTPPAKEMFKGIEMAYKNSPEFRALKSAGISSSGLRKKSLSEVARAIRQEIGEEQKNALRKLYDTLERAAEISESSTRTKVYQDVLAKTGDRAEALFAAMETINFSRKGSSRGLQIAMALIPFFNARIQGLDVFYRTMRGEKMMPNQASAEMKKAAVARFLYFVGLSSIYALLMSDHPAWVNATDEERDSNLFLPIDFIPGVRDGTAIKFPIPQELGIVSKMLPERMITMALGRSDGAELVDAMKRAVVDTLSFNPIPQVALPAVEVLGNFDFYTRRPIENQYLASLLPEDRYTEYTTGVAKLAGKAAAETPLPVSPVMVDHLIRGYFGTNGAYIADVVGRLLDMGSGAPTPERLRFSEPYLLPILGPLFKSPDGKKAVEDLYMIDEAAKMAVTTLKAYSESGRELSEAKEEELYTLAEVGEQVKPIVEEIRELNRAKRMIQSDPDLSPSEKRDELNDLQQQIISLAKEAQEFKKEVPLRLR
jgi:transcriptional regulator NrdR family protein